MHDVVQHNRARWNALAAAGVQYARPWLDLDQATARARIDPLGLLGELAGKQVLCLAAAGGQQSAAFAVLGAEVTVFDLSDEMLARDQAAARHYKTDVRTIQGDAQDLAALPGDAFDIIWQAHSVTFMPDLGRLFDGVARVLRTGGVYHLSAWNPLAHGAEDHWTGHGYLLGNDYTEGAEVDCGDGCWPIVDAAGEAKRIPGPREFRHTLTTIMNGLIARGFIFLDVREEPHGRADAQPGSWDHFCSVVPPYLCIWAVRQPDLLKLALAACAPTFGAGGR